MRLALTRLTPSEYLDTLKRGRTITHPPLQLKLLPSASMHIRYAIRISKKIIPKATQRNRYKRLIREPIHILVKTKPLPYKLIFSLLPSKVPITDHAVRAAMAHILNTLIK